VSARLYLYTVFHANLKFSSIPEDQYPVVIDRCFWPVLNLLDEFPDIKLGFEFPGETLEILESVDPEFVSAVGDSWRAGRCEVVASGYAQVIFPLVPAAVNARNLELGDETCERILGGRPVVAYVNEQTYSQGLLALYAERGYRAIVADWDNTVAHNHYPPSYRYFPQSAVGNGAVVPVLWNSSIAFQKFQRYLGGALDLNGYMSYLADQWSPTDDRAFVLYGNDWEILDYRPGEPAPLRDNGKRGELERLRKLLERLTGDGRFSVVTPSEVLDRFPPLHDVHLESSEYPIPCKKQDKYNVTRWAVCGREATLMNTECHRLEQALSASAALRADGVVTADGTFAASDRSLISLWGSDYRTFITQHKYVEFRSRMGQSLVTASETVDKLMGDAPAGGEIRLYNPNSDTWAGVPYEFDAEFGPGQYRVPPSVSIADRVLPTQLENIERRRDGSIRRARVVICPTLAPKTWVDACFVAAGNAPIPQVELTKNAVIGSHVRVVFDPSRGGTLRELVFPSIADEPLAATLPHGFFESIGLSPDWYTGGVIIFDQFNRKVTDLSPTDLVMPDPELLAEYPIRIPVRCRIELPGLGSLWKIINVYRDAPRLDISYQFRFQDLRPNSFRLGIVTVNPSAFKLESLRYVTVNGGYEPESYELKGRRVMQDEPVSLNVSSRHCLGATEGWAAVSDGTRGLAIMSDKAQCYSVPLIHFEEVESSYFLRVYTSLAENDETAAQLWRGHSEITVRYLGYQGDDVVARRESVCMNKPLLTLGACARSA
jgi:hypothetical protein